MLSCVKRFVKDEYECQQTELKAALPDDGDVIVVLFYRCLHLYCYGFLCPHCYDYLYVMFSELSVSTHKHCTNTFQLVSPLDCVGESTAL